MAKKKADTTGTPTSRLIDKVVKRLKLAIDADKHNRDEGIEDLNFINGDQWSSQERKRREDKGRPVLQINLMPKFVDQVVGDMLHNTPSIKIRPVDSVADINVAKIRQGIISQIEYQSNAKGIYGYGAKQQVSSGYGAWRILTRYTEENPFIQEAYLQGIRNPFLVYMDPAAKDQNYADAKWGILLEGISKDEFDDRYPDAEFASDSFDVGVGMADETWYDSDSVTVAEYFTVAPETVKMHQLEDGRVVSDDELLDIKEDWEEQYAEVITSIEEITLDEGQELIPPTPQQPMEPKPLVINTREIDKTVIRHYVLNCKEILEGGEKGKVFPGKYIPLVLLKGKELNIEGKNHVYSLIRHGKDPQKLINYWNSSAAETIALAPKAPWVGTPKQFEGFEKEYAAANVDNMPFLMYNPDDQATTPPMRQSPGQPPTAIFEQIRRGEENLKSVLGMYNIDMGVGSSAQTGAAVTAQQMPADVGTFEFTENLSRAIMHTGRILNEMIPEVYDTERDVRIRNFDESETFVPVNTTIENAMKSVTAKPDNFAGIDQNKLSMLLAEEGKDAKYNDITTGKYDVVVTTGPSYATQRQESAQHLLQLVQAMPNQMAVAADIIVENMDFKGADELAARLRKPIVAQGLTKPREGDELPKQPETPPEVLLAQAKIETEKIKSQTAQLKLQQDQLELQKTQIEIQSLSQGDPKLQVTAEIAKLKLQLENTKAALESEKLQSETQASVMRAQIEQERLKHAQVQQELALTQQRESHQAKMQHQVLQIEKTKAEIASKRDPLAIRKITNAPDPV